MQKQLAYEIVQKHIFQAIGVRCSKKTIVSLNATGLSRLGYTVSEVINAFKLWYKYWTQNKTLLYKEIKELGALSKYMRKLFLKWIRRIQFFDVLLNFRSHIFPKLKLKHKLQIP